MAVEWWEMNLETCSGYEKHSSGSGQYVSKKIRVIRRVEVKILQEMDEKVENGPKKKVPCIGLYTIELFHERAIQLSFFTKGLSFL